ncbi:hypothetical protein GGD56_005313 [Rhizobium mongolense]|uniref:Uncharacterized protein n=1 Tax=Rhizobium mongolense TaxID=57676 RepID=A0ABR6IU49_9HYPH|nr:hypothetical protein [Rhizobium mongolense]
MQSPKIEAPDEHEDRYSGQREYNLEDGNLP